MPTIVDSKQCHLWTDTLHARQLARETANKWDRGTYVRMCVNTSWTALEVACQDALKCPQIGYRFKENLDNALQSAALPPIDWSTGVWQKARQLQELRKSYVHRFTTLKEMFPDAAVANDAVETVRDAIKWIYCHVNAIPPAWVEFNEAIGWPAPSNFGTPSAILGYPGIAIDDPLAVRVFLLVDGREQLVRVLPPGYDPQREIQQLIQTSRIPISGVRVYENGDLTTDLIVNMRGSM